jgi:hypothetical protein
MRVFLIVLVLAALLAAPVPLDAQRISLGVQVGANSSYVVPNWTERHRTGLVAGVSGRLQLTQTLGVQVEGLYSQRGWRDGDYRLYLDYLEAPVLLRYSPAPQLLGFRLAALGGVSASTEVGCSWRMTWGVATQGDFSPPPAVDADCIGVRNQLNDFGLVLGVEAERAIPPGRFSIAGRYFYGTKNLSYAGHVLRNRGFAILLGFALNLWSREERLPN